MKFLSLEDLTGTFEAVIFPNVYEEVARKTMSMGPYIIEGKVDMETGNNIIVDRLEILNVKSVNLRDVKDSAEDKYLGDIEKFYEEEIELLEEEYYERKYAQI